MTASLVLLGALLLHAGADPELVLGGLDPVSLCGGEEAQGRAELTATHGRFVYRFADEASRGRFLAAPERWGVQWGGACGRMGPLGGVGSPERWTVHDGRIWLFASDGCRAGFLAAPERFAVAPVTLPALDPAARARGRAWIEKAVAAHGGAAAIDAQHALRLTCEGPRGEWTQRLELLLADDGALRRRSSWTPPGSGDGGTDTRWVLGDEVFVDEDGAVFPLTSKDERDDLRRFAHREPLALLWARRSVELLAAHQGAGVLAGAPVEDVLVHHAGLTTTLHLDPADGRIVGLSWRGRPGEGATREVVESFTAWSEVAGVLLPTARTVTADGEPRAELAVAWDRVELLPRAPERAFER